MLTYYVMLNSETVIVYIITLIYVMHLPGAEMISR